MVAHLLQRVLDRRAQLLQRGAVVGAGREAGVDRVGQLARQVGAEAAQRPVAAADRPRGGGGGGAAVRVFAAPALVEGQRQRVDVGLGPGLPSLGLLRRHVGEGADDVAGGGQRGSVGEVGDAEVHQLRPRFPVLDHLHVLRLDVAVDDAARVGVVERLAEVGADLADLAVGELTGGGEAGQGRALDQLGDEQGVAVLLSHLVEGDDAGMVEPRGGLGLAQDAAAGLPPLLDRLDRHRALEAAVPGLVDDAEAAATDAALDQEAVEHQGADHRSPNFAGGARFLPLVLPARASRWNLSGTGGDVASLPRAVANDANPSGVQTLGATLRKEEVSARRTGGTITVSGTWRSDMSVKPTPVAEFDARSVSAVGRFGLNAGLHQRFLYHCTAATSIKAVSAPRTPGRRISVEMTSS